MRRRRPSPYAVAMRRKAVANAESVGCPYCKAGPGWPCVTRGRFGFRDPHAQRFHAAPPMVEAQAKEKEARP